MSDEENTPVVVGSPEKEIYFKPIVSVKKLENVQVDDENEEELFKMRSKLYRYTIDPEEGGQWKERGVGDVRILKHKTRKTHRLVMRRDKTLKLCANHQLIGSMDIKQHGGNPKALVWSTPSDCSEDASGTAETLCIRFGKEESATEFCRVFESVCGGESEDKDEESEKLASDLSAMTVKEEEKKDNNDNLAPESGETAQANTSSAEPTENNKDDTSKDAEAAAGKD